MPAAAVKVHDTAIYEETRRTAPTESLREPRFRVVTRKPLPPAPRRRPNTVRNALLLAAIPTAFLLVYVLFWTMAISGGYRMEQLRAEIARMKVEQMDYRTLINQSSSPRVILAKAEALGMRRVPGKKYVRVPAEK